MLIIDKDLNSAGDRYTVRAKEVGLGRGWQVKGLTLIEAQAAIAHYYGPGHGSPVEGCGLCRHFMNVRSRM